MEKFISRAFQPFILTIIVTLVVAFLYTAVFAVQSGRLSVFLYFPAGLPIILLSPRWWPVFGLVYVDVWFLEPKTSLRKILDSQSPMLKEVNSLSTAWRN